MAAKDPFEQLKKAGLRQGYQCLLWAPRTFNDYSDICRGEDLHNKIDKKVVVTLEVTKDPEQDRNATKYSLRAKDSSGKSHKLTIFGYLKYSPWALVKAGTTVSIQAKVIDFNGAPYLSDAQFLQSHEVGKVIPVYSGKHGVFSGDTITAAVKKTIINEDMIVDAIASIRESFHGMSEQEICKLAGLKATIRDVIFALHRPKTMEIAKWGLHAAKRLAVTHITYAAHKASQRPLVVESTIRIQNEALQAAKKRLPFAPTNGEMSQDSAIDKIVEMLAEHHPMDAILSADVGVGKTVCYMVPSICAQAQGKRVAVFIPNDLLVEQVAKEFRTSFPNVPVIEVSDRLKKQQIPWDQNPILIGTSKLFAVIKKENWVADLLVVDEQQKTGRDQRDILRHRHTNVLEVTATMLPHTMALISHGSKQIIRVDKQHADKKISTQVIGAEDRKKLFQRIHEVVEAKGQVAIIYPRVANKAKKADDQGAEVEAGKESAEGIKSVIEAGQMWERHFPGKVAVIHGKMKPEEKSEAMAKAKSGECPVLISSSIIEIGVTIADLRFLMVVDPDRYGVSTLHQMRGRLVRLGGEGECYLYLREDAKPETLERLALLEKTTNGFELAEMDMELRGFGDIADESGDQSGKTPTLFYAIKLMPRDFDNPKNYEKPVAEVIEMAIKPVPQPEIIAPQKEISPLADELFPDTGLPVAKPRLVEALPVRRSRLLR